MILAGSLPAKVVGLKRSVRQCEIIAGRSLEGGQAGSGTALCMEEHEEISREIAAEESGREIAR